MPRYPVVYTLVFVAVLGSACVDTPEVSAEDGYHALFNGENLEGFTIESAGSFFVRDGVIVVDRGSGWLRSDEEFGDFTLVMEFRFMEKNANSGIFIRTAPTSSSDEKGWPDNGYQIQCMDTLEGENHLASLIPYGAGDFSFESDREALQKAYKPAGEWHTYEITCRGEGLTVKLNDLLITTATGIKKLRGHVGIQAEFGLLEFRSIRIKEL